MNTSVEKNVEAARWLAYVRPNPAARLRLFCFPYAGGRAGVYRNWAASLSPQVEVLPVQLPGRETRLRETAFSSVRPLVEALGPALLPLLDRPFAFFGHSMGALISFELARWLRRVGAAAPEQLFVSARIAPQLPDPDPPTYNLPEAEFIEEVRRLNGTPEEVLRHEELLRLLLPLLRADFSICQTYRYEEEAPLNCPIKAYGGLNDLTVTRRLLEGWGEQTAGPFMLRMMPGDHFFLHTSQMLLQTLGHDLGLLVDGLNTAARRPFAVAPAGLASQIL